MTEHRISTSQENDVSFFNDDDLNGECFIRGELGEVQVEDFSRYYYFREDKEYAHEFGQPVSFNIEQGQDFLHDNLMYLNEHYVGRSLTLNQKLIICYIRFLAVRNGLVSKHFNCADYFVKYPDYVVGKGYARARNVDKTIYQTFFTTAVRASLMKKFSNMVCLVAYMFRVRGHHWMANMDGKYQDLWSKCLYNEDMPGVEWENIAHQALHAIYPVNIDKYWKSMLDSGNISGSLTKRYNCSPAGVAAFKAIHTGAQDLAMAIPGIKNRFPAMYALLDSVVAQMNANRWTGSVNHALYNAPGIDTEETNFGALAATVLGSLESFAPSSPLRNSMALKRVANYAPITGGIISRMIQVVATSSANAIGLIKVDGVSDDT